jgi:transposase InsO family protein
VYPIEKMCQAFNVSKSGYYAWLNSEPSKRAIDNQEILQQIRLIHKESGQTYGSPRISKALKANNMSVSRPRVARLMKQVELRAKRVKRFKVTTDSKHSYPVSENLLDRNFIANAIGMGWVSDITYIRTITGWLYLTVVLDLADRKIVGWALSKTMKAKDTTIAALKMAVKNRPLIQPLMFHSDRGIQYACDEFRQELETYPLIRQSMSRRANCWDNAVAESFFKTLKVECVYDYKFADQQQAATTVFEYIEIWYNRKRLHSSLGYRTPAQMEQLLNQYALVA